MVMFGGVGISRRSPPAPGVDILVATPGRLLDHHGQGTADLNRRSIFVLDEADRMLDMGFIHDIKKVLAHLPQKKQSLLFSATFSRRDQGLADRLLNHPALIEVARRKRPPNPSVKHPVGRVSSKKELLAHLIRQGDWHQVLVFTRMKHGANRGWPKAGTTTASPRWHPRQQEPGARAIPAWSDFKKGRDPAGAGGHRHRGARHRHRPVAARR